MHYRHLRGSMWLCLVYEAWATIETPDSTGFCGLCSSGITVADCDPQHFGEGGYMRRFTEAGQVHLVLEDSDIVGGHYSSMRGPKTGTVKYSDWQLAERLKPQRQGILKA